MYKQSFGAGTLYQLNRFLGTRFIDISHNNFCAVFCQEYAYSAAKATAAPRNHRLKIFR